MWVTSYLQCLGPKRGYYVVHLSSTKEGGDKEGGDRRGVAHEGKGLLLVSVAASADIDQEVIQTV